MHTSSKLLFPCFISRFRFGKLTTCPLSVELPQGTLARLDSRNPVFYMNFPAGRLKFTGTLAFPANKYLVLRLGGGPGGSLLAEDVFENMVRALTARFVDSDHTYYICR
jgi:hypothetical protein